MPDITDAQKKMLERAKGGAILKRCRSGGHSWEWCDADRTTASSQDAEALVEGGLLVPCFGGPTHVRYTAAEKE